MLSCGHPTSSCYGDSDVRVDAVTERLKTKAQQTFQPTFDSLIGSSLLFTDFPYMFKLTSSQIYFPDNAATGGVGSCKPAT